MDNNKMIGTHLLITEFRCFSQIVIAMQSRFTNISVNSSLVIWMPT